MFYNQKNKGMSYYKDNYIDDGKPVRNFNLRANPNRMLSYKRMRILLNRLDPRGKRIPFTIRFVSQKDGQLIEWHNVVCTSRNAKKRTHTFFSTESHNYRTVKDILILMVDDYKISVD